MKIPVNNKQQLRNVGMQQFFFQLLLCICEKEPLNKLNAHQQEENIYEKNLKNNQINLS